MSTSEDNINNLPRELQHSYQRMIEEIDQLTSEAVDTNAFYNAIVNGVQRVSDCYSVNLFIINADKEWAVLEAATGKTGSLSQTVLHRRHKLAINGKSIVSRAVINHSICIANDKQNDQPMLYSSVDLIPIHSELCAPLISSQRNIIGILDIQSSEHEAFHEDECVFYNAVTEHIAGLLENKNLF